MLIAHRPKWHPDHPKLVLTMDLDADMFGPVHHANWPITPFDFLPPGMLCEVSDEYWDWIPER